MSCPNASNVNVVSFPPGACLPVEGCPGGPPVEVEIEPSVVLVTGVLVNAGDSVEISMEGQASIGVTLNYSGATGTTQFQIQATSGNWVPVELESYGNSVDITIQTDQNSGNDQVWTAELAGISKFRVLAASAITGTIQVELRASGAPSRTLPTVSSTAAGFVTSGRLPVAVWAVKRVSQAFWILPVAVFDEIDNSSIFLNKLATYSLTGKFDTVSQTLEADRGVQVFQSVQATANGNTALWTPTAGKAFRLMRYMVAVTGDAATAGGAVVTISLNDGGAAIGQDHDVFCPGAALAAGGLYTSPWIDLGNGILSAAVNNVLNVNLSAALTAGNVRVICCGTEE